MSNRIRSDGIILVISIQLRSRRMLMWDLLFKMSELTSPNTRARAAAESKKVAICDGQ